MTVKNGQEVIDRITGFTGIVTGVCDYITGCKQALIQPRIKENGDFVESRWLDMDRLTVTSTPAISLAVSDNGPDKPAPRR
jgi:hypothetical protein